MIRSPRRPTHNAEQARVKQARERHSLVMQRAEAQIRAIADREVATRLKVMEKHGETVTAAARACARRERKADLAASRHRATERVALLQARAAEAASAEAARAAREKRLAAEAALAAAQNRQIATGDAATEEDEHGSCSSSCSDLLEVLRRPRDPASAPWNSPRDPALVAAAVRRIEDVKRAAREASATGDAKLKALAERYTLIQLKGRLDLSD